MTWFRREDLAEMEKELATPRCKALLAALTAGDEIMVNTWPEQFQQWSRLEAEKKDQFIKRLFTMYQKHPGSEWWPILLLFFMKELYGLSRYFHVRIRDADENWSLVIWAFFQVMVEVRYESAAHIAMPMLCERIKITANQIMHSQQKKRRNELLTPDPEQYPDRSVTVDTEEPNHFAFLCRRLAELIADLPAIDRAIIQETYTFGHSITECGDKLGISRHRVRRKLIHIKKHIAGALQRYFSKHDNVN